MGILKNLMPLCEGMRTDIQQLLDAAKQLSPELVEANIKSYGDVVVKELMDVQQLMQAEDHDGAGVHLGLALRQVIGADGLEAAMWPATTIDEDVLMGMLKGLLPGTDDDNYSSCRVAILKSQEFGGVIKDLGKFLDNLIKAVRKFLTGGFPPGGGIINDVLKELKTVVDGVIKLLEAILKNLMPLCEGMRTDIQQLLDAAKQLSPEAVEANIHANGADIVKELMDVSQLMQSEDHDRAGVHLSLALQQVMESNDLLV